MYFFFNNKSIYDYKYFLGILNSKLFLFQYWNKLVTNKDSTPQLKKDQLELFLVPEIDLSNSDINSKYNNFLSLINEIERLYHKIANNTLTEKQFDTYMNQIITYDENINRATYDFYNLTENEIKIVEENIR